MDYGQPGVTDEKSEFAPGDFVWGKLKNQQWWPGKVQAQDSSSAVKAEHRQEKEKKPQQDSTPLRVVFFGNSIVASLNSAQLKPFVSEFGTLASSSFTGKMGYGRGTGFSGAVTKAAVELRRCVEFGLACRCVTVTDGEQMRLREVRHGSSDLGFGEVEAFVRVLYGAACGVEKVDLVEASVMQGRLTAYFRWVGRWDRSLPGYHQCEGIEHLGIVEEEKVRRRSSAKKERSMAELIASTVKNSPKKRVAEEGEKGGGGEDDDDQGFGSGRRSRKKSKYLSPPYTLMEKRSNIRNKNKNPDLPISEDDSKAIVPFGSSQPAAKSSKRRRKKKKFVLDDDVLDSVSVGQFLSEFQLMALDTSHQAKSNLLSEKMIRGFFNEFRRSVYVHGSNYENYSSKNMETVTATQVFNVDINVSAVADSTAVANVNPSLNGVEVGPNPKNKKGRKKKSVSCELGDAATTTGEKVACLENGKKKRRKKKEVSNTTATATATAVTIPKPPLNFVQKSLEKMITTLKNSGAGEREKLAEEMSELLIKVNKMLSNAAADVKDSNTTTPTTAT